LQATDINTNSDCYNCVTNLSNNVCRDIRSTYQSYCCEPSEVGLACTKREFCSH